MRAQTYPPARVAATPCGARALPLPLPLLLLLLLLSGARAQVSPSSTPGAVGCVARYIRVENTPGVANQNFYVRSLPSTQK